MLERLVAEGSERSWWRHEQPRVAAALVAARHHSPFGTVEEVATRQGGSEGEVEELDAPRGPKPPLQVTRLEQPPEALGRLERAACPRSRVPHFAPVVMVQEAAQDARLPPLADALARHRAEEEGEGGEKGGGVGG